MHKPLHTPGPWTVAPPVNPDDDMIVEACAGRMSVCDVHNHDATSMQHDGAEAAANARLIAAAPEMFEALHMALRWMEQAGAHCPDAMAAFRTAIAKAEG